MLFLLSPIYVVNYIKRFSVVELSLHSWYSPSVRFSSPITMSQISGFLLPVALPLLTALPLKPLKIFCYTIPEMIPSSLVFSLFCTYFFFFIMLYCFCLFKCLPLPLNSILTEGMEWFSDFFYQCLERRIYKS